jgi:hypothetical protein
VTTISKEKAATAALHVAEKAERSFAMSAGPEACAAFAMKPSAWIAQSLLTAPSAASKHARTALEPASVSSVTIQFAQHQDAGPTWLLID